jgi:hypothetical protein
MQNCIEGYLALSHKKNPRILQSKTAGFLHKNQLARSFAIVVAEAHQIFVIGILLLFLKELTGPEPLHR